MLHGWPYDIHTFAEVSPLLAAAGYRVIVPYLRGYGTTRFLSDETFRNGQQSVLSELGLARGTPVRLVGFVSAEPQGARPFELSRFYITCCVADAVPVGVHVEKGFIRHLRLERDDWLDVTAVLARRRREWVVRGTRIEHVDPPSNPYLPFTG